MDEEQGGQGHKISLPEGILILLVFVVIDGVEIAILFFALDDFWILDTISSGIFLYLFIKSVPPIYQLIAWLAELVPWLGALPLLTAGWGLTWGADAYPESRLGQAISKAASLAPTSKGALGKTAAVANEAESAAAAAQKIEGGVQATEKAAATAGIGAAEGVAEEAGGVAAKTKEIPGEALGEKESVFEEMEEPFKNVVEQQPAKPKEEEYNSEEGANAGNPPAGGGGAPQRNAIPFPARGENKSGDTSGVEVEDNDVHIQKAA